MTMFDFLVDPLLKINFFILRHLKIYLYKRAYGRPYLTHMVRKL